MSNICKIIDGDKIPIYLTKERWNHIIQEHPEMSSKLEEIIFAIKNSFLIRDSKYDSKVKFFYNYHKSDGKYLLIAVKYLRDKGFIITAFFVRSVQK